jgi:hypothetical protein
MTKRYTYALKTIMILYDGIFMDCQGDFVTSLKGGTDNALTNLTVRRSGTGLGRVRENGLMGETGRAGSKPAPTIHGMNDNRE